jgi:hypothetical protein
MARWRCRTQCFFIDTCSTWDGEDPPEPNLLGESLETPLTASEIRQLKSRCAPVLYASEKGEPAFAFEATGTTPFVDLILEAVFKGGCAHRETRRWEVRPFQMCQKVFQLADWLRNRDNTGFPKKPELDYPKPFSGVPAYDAVIHFLTGPPDIETCIYLPPADPAFSPSTQVTTRLCVPGAAPNSQATFPTKVLRGDDPWEVTLPAGQYEVSVTDPATPALNRKVEPLVMVQPPPPCLIRNTDWT